MNPLHDVALAPDQRALLTCMAEAWFETGEWPKWGYVQHHFDRGGLDAEAVLRSLPRVGADTPYAVGYGYTTSAPRHLADDDTVRLTVAASLVDEHMDTAIGRPFVAALRHMIEIYLGTKPFRTGKLARPAVRSDEVHQLLVDSDAVPRHLADRFVAALPELLSCEPGIAAGGRRLYAEGTWRLEITRSVLQYRATDGVAAYVDRTCDIVTANAAQYTGAASFAQVAFAHDGAICGAPSPQPTTDIPVRPVAPHEQAPYLDDDLLTDLEHAARNTRWKVHKLLALCRELNSNYAARNPYSCAALIRAITDHIPPVFGHTGFKQVAAQHPFGRTDKDHARSLAGYKAIGDDTLHRQIAAGVPAITMHDVPPPAFLSAVLHELVRVLRKREPS